MNSSANPVCADSVENSCRRKILYSVGRSVAEILTTDNAKCPSRSRGLTVRVCQRAQQHSHACDVLSSKRLLRKPER
jgi:hypothetical protein